ncbi:MAG: hypothetical protein ACM3S2_20730 [Ignavibacteriales bacterium]
MERVSDFYMIKRAKSIMLNSIENLCLDLTGFTVLTEVGSGNYCYLPLIAALAGAKKVFAWTSDSPYGSGKAIAANCLKIAKEFCVSERIEIAVNEKPLDHIKNADIITNSGFLRPLNADKLAHAKKNVVIPLMYEAWELRDGEVDIDFCRDNGIKVAGTWENHPLINVFEYVGMLASKMAFEAGYEIFQNRIAIWSNDEFGKVIEKAFLKMGAAEVLMTTNANELENAGYFDFVFFCDYDETREILGPNGFLNAKLISNSGAGVVHLYGCINSIYLSEQGINVYPLKDGYASRMTFTLGHVGPEPIIRLQTAGLKVAQNMMKFTESDLNQIIC